MKCRYLVPFLRRISCSQQPVTFYGSILSMFFLSGRWGLSEVYSSTVAACSQSQWLWFQLTRSNSFLKQLQKNILCFVPGTCLHDCSKDRRVTEHVWQSTDPIGRLGKVTPSRSFCYTLAMCMASKTSGYPEKTW